MGWLRPVLIALACAAATTTSLAQPLSDPAFASFWESFRTGVRTGDADRLAALTRFPLAVHGQLDADKVQRVNEAQFRKDLTRWLEQDTGMSAESESVRSFIARTDAATLASGTRNRGGSGTSVRVGGFHFEHQAGAWRLTRIYEER